MPNDPYRMFFIKLKKSWTMTFLILEVHGFCYDKWTIWIMCHIEPAIGIPMFRAANKNKEKNDTVFHGNSSSRSLRIGEVVRTRRETVANEV